MGDESTRLEAQATEASRTTSSVEPHETAHETDTLEGFEEAILQAEQEETDEAGKLKGLVLEIAYFLNQETDDDLTDAIRTLFVMHNAEEYFELAKTMNDLGHAALIEGLDDENETNDENVLTEDDDDNDDDDDDDDDDDGDDQGDDLPED